MSTSPVQALPTKPWYRYLTKEDRKAFFAAWIGVLLDGYDFVLISFALPAIKTAFDLSLVQSASLISAAFISRWIGGLVLGAIGDRYGRKPAMILSIFMFAFGSIACALAPNFWILFVLRLIIGFAMAGEYSASAAYVIESWPKHMRNKASGFLLSGYAFGVIAAAQVDKYFVTWVDSMHPGWGWRALFLTGIIPIVVAIYMRKTLPEAADWSEAKEKGHVEKNDMLQVLFGGERKILNYVVVAIAFIALLLIFTQQVGGVVAVSVLGALCAAIFIYLIIQFDSKRWIIGIAIMLTIFASFMYTWPIQGLLPTYLRGVGMDQTVVANVVSFAGLGNAAATSLLASRVISSACAAGTPSPCCSRRSSSSPCSCRTASTWRSWRACSSSSRCSARASRACCPSGCPPTSRSTSALLASASATTSVPSVVRSAPSSALRLPISWVWVWPWRSCPSGSPRSSWCPSVRISRVCCRRPWGRSMFVLKMETTTSSKRDDHHDTSFRYRRVCVASGAGAGG